MCTAARPGGAIRTSPQAEIVSQAIQVIDRRLSLTSPSRAWRPLYRTTIAETQIQALGELRSREACIRGGVYSVADVLFVVFDGMSDAHRLLDTLVSLGTDPIPAYGPGVTVHEGYYHTLSAWWAEGGAAVLQAAVNLRPWRSVVVAGYSMGGAYATLCGALLATSGTSCVEVVTINSPCVGKRSFVRWYERLGVPTLNLSYGSDFASRFPAEGLGWCKPGVTQHVGPPRGALPRLDHHYLQHFYQSVDPGFVWTGPEAKLNNQPR
jgi:hypothetical protein